MQYESLIFDIDGTLWDSTALVAEGYNVQLRKEGLAHLCVTRDDLLKLFGRTMAAIADAMFETIPAPERYALMDRCIDSEQEYLWANQCDVYYPGVKETLEALAKKYRLFIVTNAQKGYPEVCMEKLGVSHLFSGHLTYGDTLLEKSETIKLLMQRHGIENAVYIGDTQGDYQAATAAGLPFIWATYGFGVPESHIAKVDHFPQLLEIL
jgi:phosphoglycolate phosphatase